MQVTRDNFQDFLQAGDDSPGLAGKLHELVCAGVCSSATVVLADAERSACTSVGGPAGAELPALDVGCISKLITVVTYFHVFGKDRAARNARVCEVLGIDAPGFSPEITVEHLLNHSHGVDEPLNARHLTDGSGRIDVRGLLEAIGPRPLAAPGALYSYSALGMRLLAAVIEARCSQPFINVVRETIPGIIAKPGNGGTLCPAFGGGQQIAVRPLLEHFVRATTHGTELQNRVLPLGLGLLFSHPGWHPLETGVCNGWKAYTLGWFGHVSLLPHAPSIRVQVSPADGFGILVSTSAAALWKVVFGVCAESFVGSLRPIESYSGAQGAAPRMSWRGCAGIYERVDSRLDVLLQSGGLVLEVRQRTTREDQFPAAPTFVARLQPLRNGILAVIPPNAALDMGIVEFLGGTDGAAGHLWCKGRIWRRMA